MLSTPLLPSAPTPFGQRIDKTLANLGFPSWASGREIVFENACRSAAILTMHGKNGCTRQCGAGVVMGDGGILPIEDFAGIDSRECLAAEPKWCLQTGKVVHNADWASRDRKLRNWRKSFKLIVAQRRIAHRKRAIAVAEAVDSAIAAHRKVVDVQLVSLRIIVVPAVDEWLNKRTSSCC